MGFFGRTLSRIDEVKRVLSREPGARQFLAQADELRRAGQLDEAIDVLERGLAQSPGSVAGHVALGRLLQQNGRLDPALAAYQAALKLDPQNLVALRQTADLFLSRGEKVEAIKKLKLFRGLSPGDREVNELIRQLDEEIAASARAARPEATQPFPAAAPEGAGPSPRPAVPPLAVPSAAPAPVPAVLPPLPPPPALSAAGFPPAPALPPPVPSDASADRGLAGIEVSPVERAAGPLDAAGAFMEELPPFDARPVERPAEEPAPFETEPPVTGGPSEGPLDAAPAPFPEEPSAPPAAPGATETLAELLRAQGHLGEAREAYLALAESEPDEVRSGRYRAIAREIEAARAETARGRLEAWVEPFSRRRAGGEVDLVAAVEGVVARLGPSAAVVTDLEGVPVVSAGPRSEAEAMESLAAELTAFWKNVRRSRGEIGEGALDSLVLTGSDGTAAIKAVTPSYALLLKAGPGVSAGRIRFEAARAAEQLRPALL